ncbi:hypothetical protein FKM82_019097 [Ascaphus truei]
MDSIQSNGGTWAQGRPVYTHVQSLQGSASVHETRPRGSPSAPSLLYARTELGAVGVCFLKKKLFNVGCLKKWQSTVMFG